MKWSSGVSTGLGSSGIDGSYGGLIAMPPIVFGKVKPS
jgi:hypothetical protein